MSSPIISLLNHVTENNNNRKDSSEEFGTQTNNSIENEIKWSCLLKYPLEFKYKHSKRSWNTIPECNRNIFRTAIESLIILQRQSAILAISMQNNIPRRPW